jgi:hypothetical protein
MKSANDQNSTIKALDNDLKIKRREARREYKCHFGAAEHYRRIHTTCGSVAVICGVIAGSGFFGEACHGLPFLNYVGSFLTLVAACLTGLITYNRYAELSALHNESGHKWERLRDKYEMMILKTGPAASALELDGLLGEYESLSAERQKVRDESVSIPGWLFRRHKNIKDKTELEEE